MTSRSTNPTSGHAKREDVKRGTLQEPGMSAHNEDVQVGSVPTGTVTRCHVKGWIVLPDIVPFIPSSTTPGQCFRYSRWIKQDTVNGGDPSELPLDITKAGDLAEIGERAWIRCQSVDEPWTLVPDNVFKVAVNCPVADPVYAKLVLGKKMDAPHQWMTSKEWAGYKGYITKVTKLKEHADLSCLQQQQEKLDNVRQHLQHTADDSLHNGKSTFATAQSASPIPHIDVLAILKAPEPSLATPSIAGTKRRRALSSSSSESSDPEGTFAGQSTDELRIMLEEVRAKKALHREKLERDRVKVALEEELRELEDVHKKRRVLKAKRRAMV